MEIRQLRYFVAAAETGNISKAAHRMNVSQPPVSRQIRVLEHELGFDLFRRTARGVELTSAGKCFFVDAQRILADTQIAKRSAQAANRGEIGTLEVAFFGSIIYRAVPLALATLREQQPKVQISISRQSKAQQMAALQSGVLQIGFGRYYDDDPMYEVLTLAKEPVLLAMPKMQDIADGEPITIEDAMSKPITLFPAGGRPNFADHLLASLNTAGLSPKSTRECEDVTTALAQIVDGNCHVIVPASSSALQFEGISFHPIVGLDVKVPINCIYLKDNRSPILDVFLKSLDETDFSSLSTLTD